MLSLRIWPHRYERDDEFENTLRFLAPYRDTLDEIVAMTDQFHVGGLPLCEFEVRFQILQERFASLREKGYRSAGLNLVTTFGHLDEGAGALPDVPYQPIIGHDGATSPGVYCPNDPAFVAYILQKYILAAQAGPAFIWVDDDFRLNHKGVPFFCFCQRCVRDFCARHGYRHTWREALCKALDAPDGGVLRLQWQQYQIDLLETVMTQIEQAVHKVSPDIPMGFMTISPAGVAQWARASKAVKFRPGGGFYEDNKPAAYIYKAFEIGLQNAQLPPEVTDVQYELDNNLMTRFDKSNQVQMAECSAALLYGCTGLLFNSLDIERGHKLDDKDDFFRALARYKPVWETLVGDRQAHRAGSCRGAYVAMDPMQYGKRERLGGESFFYYESGDIGGTGGAEANVLAELSAPLTPDRRGADVTVLSGVCAGGFTNEELRSFLSGPLMMDYQTLELLHQRGLGAYCGGQVLRRYPAVVEERFTGHVINGDNTGYTRSARVGFGSHDAVLFACEDGAEVLSELTDYAGAPLGPASYTWKNSLGGRLVVFGYAPWRSVHASEKRRQLLDALDWLSPMPTRVLDEVKICPVVRDNGPRRLLMLTSLWCDTAEQCRVAVRGRYQAARELCSGEPVSLTAQGDETILEAGAFLPWAFKLFELF